MHRLAVGLHWMESGAPHALLVGRPVLALNLLSVFVLFCMQEYLAECPICFVGQVLYGIWYVPLGSTIIGCLPSVLGKFLVL